MNGQFSGMVSTVESDSPVKLSHRTIVDNSIDPRISVIKEYLSKSPNASFKDLKKALTGFSKASDDELKNIIKSANEQKFNDLFSQTQIQTSVNKTRNFKFFSNKEIEFLEKYRITSLKHKEIYDLYQKEFPESSRKIGFISDYYHSYKEAPIRKRFELKNTEMAPIYSTHNHVLAKAITALYKSGKSPKVFSEIKPIIELINDPSEIDFAIECLTS